MIFIEFSTGINDENRRFDRVVRKHLKSLPLAMIYKNIRTGRIRLNNQKKSGETRISAGDTIQIDSMLLQSDSQNNPEIIPKVLPLTQHIDTIFENEHLKIIYKPYGTLVHGASNKKEQSLDKIIQDEYAQKNRGTQSLSFLPGPLHRLDRNTSGILVFSQSLLGAQWFTNALQAHRIQKKYLGLTHGCLQNTQTWIDCIEKKESKGTSFVKVQENTDGKHAHTIARPLLYGTYKSQEVTLTEYCIITGRTHQIRFQSAYHGFPLLGDTAYGAERLSGESRLFYLHCYYVEFPQDNPLGLPKQIICPIGKDFELMAKNCLIELPETIYNGMNV